MKLLKCLALTFSLTLSAHAITINYITNAAGTSCFLKTYNDVASGCQAGGLNVTYTNAQGDSAMLSWGGSTGSVSFNSGQLQPTSYGNFALGYTSNNNDLTPVSIPLTSFKIIIKEFSPTTIFYQPILVNFSNVIGDTTGLVGPSTSTLQATFGPTSVTNGTDTTFFLPSSVLPINLGQNAVGGQILETATPEISTWLLLATAMPLLFGRRLLQARKHC